MSSLVCEFKLDLHLVKRLSKLDFTDPVSLDLNYARALSFNLLPDEKILIIFPDCLNLCQAGLLSSAQRIINSARNCRVPETAVSEALTVFIQTRKGLVFNFSKMPLTNLDHCFSPPLISLEIETLPSNDKTLNVNLAPSRSRLLPELIIKGNQIEPPISPTPSNHSLAQDYLPTVPKLSLADRKSYLATQTLTFRQENLSEKNRHRSKFKFFSF